ncbi:MAG: MerR family transcriptional regulator [Desulfobulbus propionicus]|nr:MAG: MerR family transcriptional regulator [Desulfobulbus propionicus]
MKNSAVSRAQLPDKRYFRIGEVSALIGVDTHVLRYWETEFPRVKPRRARSGQRLYQRQDVELLLRIKQLLHEEGYTISGARKLLSATPKNKQPPAPAKMFTPGQLTEMKKELQGILGLLKKKQH